MYGGQLLQVIHIGHGRRLNAQHPNTPGHAPMGQFQADSRELVPIGRRAHAAAPARPQEQPVTRPDLVCRRPEIAHADQGPFVGCAMHTFSTDWVRDPGQSHAPVERDLVDGPVRDTEMGRGVHVGTAVGIEVQRRRIPAVLLDGLGGLDGHTPQGIVERQRQVDDPRHGTL